MKEMSPPNGGYFYAYSRNSSSFTRFVNHIREKFKKDLTSFHGEYTGSSFTIR